MERLVEGLAEGFLGHDRRPYRYLT
ncbi:UNVERIFIED_ORG: hypothetical protein GGI57_006640 [Rhizobium aethiopicum]